MEADRGDKEEIMLISILEILAYICIASVVIMFVAIVYTINRFRF